LPVDQLFVDNVASWNLHFRGYRTRSRHRLKLNDLVS
jgi:hypothetical protein